MSHITRRELLSHFHHVELDKFKLNNDPSVVLPIPSEPVFKGEPTEDFYAKTADVNYPAVLQVKKNGDPVGIVWHTTADKMEEAIRLGAPIPVESITAKVINAIGRYHVTRFKRADEGMTSNTDPLKEALTNHFQSRFKLLQPLELFVNHPIPPADQKNNVNALKKKFIDAIEYYKTQLAAQRDTLQSQFHRTGLDTYSRKSLELIKKNIQMDIDKTNMYLEHVRNTDDLSQFMCASGNDSILEFAKRRMKRGVYRMQTVNQNVTYSVKRRFAATRGELNNCIEDAKFILDAYDPDLCNQVTNQHHGIYGGKEDQVALDCVELNLSSDAELDLLRVIGHVEKYNELDSSDPLNPKLKSNGKVFPLQKIHATSWRISLTPTILFEKLWHMAKNFFMSFLFSTRPYAAVGLLKYAKPYDPFWYKAWKGIKAVWLNIRDVFKSIFNLFYKLFWTELPSHIRNDYYSTDVIRDTNGKEMTDDAVIKEAEEEIANIKKEEEKTLTTILNEKDSNGKKTFPNVVWDKEKLEPMRRLAHVDYHLTPGDQNDILTSVARGVEEFVNVFSQNLYAKHPFEAGVYSATFLFSIAIILSSQLAAQLGAVGKFTQLVGSATGSSVETAAFGAANVNGPLALGIVNALIDGPKSFLARGLGTVVSDPASAVAYVGAGWLFGYLLANGIGGIDIPTLSKILREDMGENPDASYMFIALKVYVLVYELLHRHESDPFKGAALEIDKDLVEKLKMIMKFKISIRMACKA